MSLEQNLIPIVIPSFHGYFAFIVYIASKPLIVWQEKVFQMLHYGGNLFYARLLNRLKESQIQQRYLSFVGKKRIFNSGFCSIFFCQPFDVKYANQQLLKYIIEWHLHVRKIKKEGVLSEFELHMPICYNERRFAY